MALMMKNVDRIAHALKRHGVELFFGQSNPPGLATACEKIGIRQIGYRAENTGSYMPSAYAMCSGKVPVLMSQNGAAAALCVAGLSECLNASYPCVALVQDIYIEYDDKNAFQEINLTNMFAPVTKWVRRVLCQERIEDYIDMAFVEAASGRPGPVVLLLPTGLIQDMEPHPVNPYRKATNIHFPLDRSLADPAMIELAADKLAAAKAPFIYAGGGVISSGAAELRAIQRDCAIPVATTTMGKGSVDETDPLTMGPIGYYMGHRGQTRFMRPMVEQADLILLVGNRTNQNGTDMWKCLPYDAEYIHIDVDPLEISRNYESLRLCGDAKLTLAALHEALQKRDLRKRFAAKDAVAAQIAEAKAAHRQDIQDVTCCRESPIRVERFLQAVEKHLEPDHIIVSDASFSSIWLANYIPATAQRKFVFPRGMAGIGWGLPLAIGAKAAAPDRKVFCLAGDGGFAHAWTEIETLKREHLPMVVAVINNEILGYQKYNEQAIFGESSTAVELTAVNHAKLAEACGVKGIRIERESEIEAALEAAFALNEPVIVDFVAEPGCIPPLPYMEKLEDIFSNV